MNRLIRLYPAAWRQRYGDELAELLEERPPSMGDRLDIVRGALDARMHAQVPGREIPRGHRLPGILALAAGLFYCVFFIGVALPVVDPNQWGMFAYLIPAAILLALVSLPGSYFERYSRQLKWAFFGLVGLWVAAAGLPWPLSVAAALGLVLLVAAGMLTLATVRAGLSTRWRWLIVATVFVPEFLIAFGFYAAGAGLDGNDAPLATLGLVLPYGLAWVAVGLLMLVRGSPTFEDPAALAVSADGLVR